MSQKLRALVVYESMFGNTRLIAEAVRDGLRDLLQVDLVSVGTAPDEVGADLDLLVVGGPTHGFGMSRRSTRTDAAIQGVVEMPPTVGIREWVGRLPDRQGLTAAATFDTRMMRLRWLPGSAARGAAGELHRRGFRLLTTSTSFFVVGTTGPLADGEKERATRWGRGLATDLQVSDDPSGGRWSS